MFRKFSFFISFVLVLCLVGNASAFTIGEKDIGGPAIAGSSSIDDVNNIWTVVGSGADIWGSADQFHYVYRPLAGDGVLEAKITSMTLTDAWAKAGVMIRETSAANSKFAIMAMTGSNGVQLAYRNSTGGGCAESSTAGQVVPAQLRLTRTGNDFKAEYGFELMPGMWVWADQATVNIPMNTDVLIGLAVCSHNNTLLCTSVFEELVLTAPAYEKAWDLNPLDGSSSLPLTPTLTWLPGDSATSHDVYMGTDPGALTLVDTKLLGDESYTPGTPLAEGTVYYWQIVEQPGAEASAVMSFKTERLGTGTILREVWTGIGGTMPSDLYANPAYPLSPSWSDYLTSMASYDFADDYGARMQGFLYPETSGDYTFWIASDDASELWLSSDEKSCNAERIAYHNAWTGAHNWFWYAEQQSAPVSLVGGQRYFIRAVWKEGGGGDNCQVAWSGPDQPAWPVDGSNSAVINGYYLMPSIDPYAGNPNPANGSTVTVHEAATVTWAAGKGAVSHDVYLGTDPGAMTLVATVPMPATSCALPALAVGVTYYWQVDAYDGVDTYVGCPFSFTTAEWIALDIGTSGGSTSIDPVTGIITINADGGDIWDSSDQFHYYYTTMEMTRDTGEVIARVLTVPTTNDWSKTGVMIRETRAANSRHAIMASTLWDAATLQYRTSTGGGSGDQTEGGWDQPRYMRLTRQGNTLTGYHSADGENWITRGSVDIGFTPGKYVCIGLAVTSHVAGTIGTATFEDLQISTPDPRQAWGPTPTDGAVNVPLYTTLRFNAGEDADEHRLYFSDDYDDVYYGLVTPVVLPAGTTEYAVGPMSLGKPYYWVVDEVIQEGREWPVTMGEVWSFRVEDSRLVEDFEPYDDPPVPPEALPEQETIPGGILVEAVPPADQAWVEPQVVDDGAVIATDPEQGQVVSLDGGMDYVDCGNPPALNFGTGDWTLSAWVKNTMTGTGDINKGAIIANGGDGGGGKRYCLVVSEAVEGKVNLVVDDDVTKKEARGDITVVNDGVWHHVLGMRDANSIKIYIDGNLEGSATLPTIYDLSGTAQRNLLIGAIYKQSDGTIYKDYAGLIDDVRIYDYSLADDEVAYMAGEDGNEPSVGPIAHWAFEGDFNDSSGNGYDGTPQGYTLKPGYYSPCIASYGLDEGSGSTATDSSGNGLDGVITDANWTFVTADGSASCLDFNGFGGNVLNSAAGPYLNNLDGLSISMWVQSDLINTDKGFIILGNDASDRLGMRYDAAGSSGGGTNVIKYGVTTTGGNEEDESSANLQTTEWQHLVMTWQSGAGLKLWVNGVLDVPSYNAASVSGVLTGYTRIMIGKGSKDLSATASWDGRIDAVQIYDTALSEGEVRYLAGVGNTYLPDWYSPLIVRYEFEGDANDSSGNGLDGTLYGDAIVEDGVLKLDGAGDYLDVGATPLTNITGQVTVSGWLKLNAVGGDMKVAGNQDGSTGGYKLGYADNKLEFEIRTSGGSAILNRWEAGGTVLAADTWYHVAGVYSEGNYIRTYVNGILDRELATTEVLGGSAGTLKIGREPFSDGGYLNGMVDGFRLYNVALTMGQMLTLAEYSATNPIHGTWSENGATLALDYIEKHGGAKSMKVDIGSIGEVSRSTPYTDFDSGDAKALVLYFKGDPCNVIDDMYLALATAGSAQAASAPFSYDGDMNDLASGDWVEWNIDISGVSGAVEQMALGLSGVGTVNFDDIRLYPKRCRPELGPLSDFTDDCLVDGRDARIMAADWLMYDESSIGLVARFEFEGNLEDSSGLGHHATAHGTGIGFETDANMGMVLSLPGGDSNYVSVPPVGISGNDLSTIACWAKANHTSIPDWTLVFGFSTPGGDCGSHFNIGSIGGPGGVGAHAWCWEETIFTDTEALEWRHYAMTYDGSRIDYYGDGVWKDTDTGKSNVIDLWRRGDYVNIGKRNTQESSFPGKVDDARVYKRLLTDAEIVTVMGGGEIDPIYFPIESVANIYDEEPINSKIINFKDYAILANEWLTLILWP